MSRRANAMRKAALAAALLTALARPAGAAQEVYDANHRLIQSVDENGVVIVYVYDASGRLVQARYSDGRIVDYDENGQPKERKP